MSERWTPSEWMREDGRLVIPEDLVDATLRTAAYYERDHRRFRSIGCGFGPVADVAGMNEIIVKGGAGTAGALMRLIVDKINEEYVARGGKL